MWLNDGQGRFSSSGQIIGYPPSDVGDADGDGDLDALSLSGYGPGLWLNQNPDQINHPPVAADDGYTVEQGSALQVAAAGVLADDSDPDGQALVAAQMAGPLHAMSFELRADGSFSYTPWPNFSGPDSFTYEARDPVGLATTATVTLFVVPGSAPPVAVDDFATTRQGVTVGIDVTANDTDRSGYVDPATITFLSEPTLGQVSVDLDSGVVTYVPQPAFTGTDRFAYQITGPTGLTDAAVVTVEILPGNARPTAEADAAMTNEETPVTIDVTANDRDADGNLDPATVRIVSGPANGSASVESPGVIRYSPAPAFFGDDLLTYEVCDTEGACARAVVTLTVKPVPNAPSANDDDVETRVNRAVTVPVVANDFDSDDDLVPSTVRVLSDPHDGRATVDPANGSITYEPREGFTGTDEFFYEVCDETELCDAAIVTIVVRNDPPVGVDDRASTSEAVPVAIDLAANDLDPDGNLDPSSVRIVSAPGRGVVTVDPQTGSAMYTPRSGFSGVDLFSYEISDTSGARTTAVAAVIVSSSENNPPDALNDDSTVDEDSGANTIDVLVNDTTAPDEGELLTIIVVTQGTHGSVEINSDGVALTYRPNDNYFGVDAFAYTISDGRGGTDSGTVRVSVRPISDPPMADDDRTRTPYEAAVTLDLLANDRDPDGDPLVVTYISSPAHGSIVDNGDGTVTYTPQSGYAGDDSFDYTISDGAGGTATAAATVTVSATAGECAAYLSGPPAAAGAGKVTARVAGGWLLVQGGHGGKRHSDPGGAEQ